jgi:NAD(P)H-hydrate epimerase
MTMPSVGSTPLRYATSAAEMRALDAATIAGGTPGIVLMEHAGRGAADVARRMLSAMPLHGRPPRVAVIAGPGQNGGDGFVVARLLAGDGAGCRVYLVAPDEKIHGDARTNLDRWSVMGGAAIDVSAADALAQHRDWLASCDLIIDAIFGTGLEDMVRSPYREAIEMLGTLDRPILALDIASGIDSDRGRVMGAAVRAQATVTFGFSKRGHYLYPGAAHTGALHIVDIGIPDAVVRSHAPVSTLFDEARARDVTPHRSPDSHKGTFGHLLVVAGGAGRTGAALLAARAAHRSGVGLVTIAAPQAGRVALDAKVVETMTESLGDTLDADAAARVLSLASGRALAIGPGLGTSDEARAFVMSVLRGLETAAVADADALTALAHHLDELKTLRAPLILTPHPGEMARLLGTTSTTVQSDRVVVAAQFARAHNLVLVLKGACTVVADPRGATTLHTAGNAGMATGGSGDVLTGIIGALLAQRLAPADAARLGVYIHGTAGDAARERVGETALIGSDIVDALPAAWRAIERTSR